MHSDFFHPKVKFTSCFPCPVPDIGSTISHTIDNIPIHFIQCITHNNIGFPAQYALGKLLQSQHRMDEAVSWYEKAAAQENTCAAYRLGKLYLEGKDVPKDVPKAVDYLTFSAEQGNQYAQYALGKLYLAGQDVKQDREQAWAYFYESAEQGNEYANFFLEHFDQAHRPNVFLSATRLLHHLSQIFRDNSVPPVAPVGQQVDRKLRRKIQKKKIAMGHKPNDHEETLRQDMGGMTMGW